VARRFIEKSDPEPTLFVVKHYAYRAWHTNLPLTPAGVWHFYDGRAGMERRIQEIREDYASLPDTGRWPQKLRLVNSPVIAMRTDKMLHRVHRLKPLQG
jgi:hypothetical protein